MSPRYDLALFDLDGTLTNSEPGILSGHREAFRHVGWPVPGPEVLRKFIGPPFGNIMAELFPDMPRETTEELIRYYREYYNRRGAFENSVYPGINALLEDLRRAGVKLAVATSKPATPTKRVLDYFGLSPRFDYVSAESDTDYGGGKEFLIRPALEHFGIPASRAVMIGDTKYDAAGARKAGTHFIGALYGFGTREEMEREGAENFVETVEDLRKFLIDK